MKPLECFRRPITYHTLPGEIIYEPFAGSGTALIAAEMSGRTCYAMEISPAFCDVICRALPASHRHRGGAPWLRHRAEVARRIEDIVPLVIDCFTLREIRAWT